MYYGIDLYQSDAAQIAYEITNNTFTSVSDQTIYVGTGCGGSCLPVTGTNNGRIADNTFRDGGGSEAVYIGIDASVEGGVTIENNDIGNSDISSGYGTGIGVMVHESAKFNATIAGNTVRLDPQSNGLGYDVRLTGLEAATASQICLDFHDNTWTGHFGTVFSITTDDLGMFGIQGLAEPSGAVTTKTLFLDQNPELDGWDAVYDVSGTTFYPCDYDGGAQ
jgi:hypothetical protein